MENKAVFVTVGTTLFESLTKQIDKDETLIRLSQLGYKNLTIQIGKGSYKPRTGERAGDVEVSCFDYVPDISNLIRQSDLVISHAGAGTVMEVLHAEKPLIVVVNDVLMNNHQAELAKALDQRNYAISTGPNDLIDALDYERLMGLEKYPSPANRNLFLDCLNEEMLSC
mmetsp:Transcript_17249/g.25570  ORF Transcript_17249/g.25570 Transcript_17249/m.25570 type:complete len:169 (-) Transcript_17249:16-522(-)